MPHFLLLDFGVVTAKAKWLKLNIAHERVESEDWVLSIQSHLLWESATGTISKRFFRGIHPYRFLCAYVSILSKANLVYPHAKLESARSLLGQENVKMIYTHQRVDWNLMSFGLLPKCWILLWRIGKTSAFPVFCLEGVLRSLFHDLPFLDFNALHQVVTKTCCRGPDQRRWTIESVLGITSRQLLVMTCPLLFS